MNETNANPLNMSLNDLDVSMPLLAKGPYDLRITKAEMKKTAGKGGAAVVDMLALELATTDPAQSVKGDPLAPGVKLFTNVILAPVGKMDWLGVGRGVASLVQAAKLDLAPYGSTGMDQLRAAPTWHKMLEGRVARAQVDYIPEGPDKSGVTRRAKNEIAYFSKS